MNRNAFARAVAWSVALVVVICIAAVAQQTMQVEKGEVLYVAGNTVVVKMGTGEVRHFTVSPDATATVDGKEIGVKDLKSGMKLERTITTTSTPRTVKSVRKNSGAVWQVNAPYVIVTMPDGNNRQFKVPEGTKFTVDGEEKTMFDLKPGMKITATVVTEAPETVVTTKKKVTGTAAAPVKPVVAKSLPKKWEGPLLIDEAAPGKP